MPRGSNSLSLAQLLSANPLLALAFLTCLATILWCILLTRRQRNGLDKLLTGLLGLIAIYQALRILSDSGLAAFARFRTLEGWVDLISACLYMLAAFILKTSSIDRATTQVHLRLVEAELVETEDKAAEMTSAVRAAVPELGHPLVDAAPLAIVATDAHGITTYWNPAAENLLGWTRHEVVGHELPFDLNGPLEAKNGSIIEAAVWTSPIRSLNGQPSGTLIIAAGKGALHLAGLELSRSRLALRS
jgi:PAS domain-containing protein